jgi:transcription elongation factor GreA
MPNEMTKNDIKKIEEEIEHRKLIVRKECIEAVKEARAQGDLSENFEYYAAKRDKNRNESRIRYLERLIKTATIIEDDTQDDEIGLYSVVDLYMEEDDETMTVKVVTSIRGDSMKGFISIDSPLGKAIKGHKLGDRIYIKVSDDYGYYVVVKGIEQTMDDGTDDIRSY